MHKLSLCVYDVVVFFSYTHFVFLQREIMLARIGWIKENQTEVTRSARAERGSSQTGVCKKDSFALRKTTSVCICYSSVPHETSWIIVIAPDSG